MSAAKSLERSIEPANPQLEATLRETTVDVAHGLVSSTLRHAVHSIVGYDERIARGLCRVELPRPKFVMIVELGPALRIAKADTQAGQPVSGGFAAGLQLTPTPTEHDGWQRCIQIDVAPSQANALLGHPASEFTDRVVSMSDLLGSDELAERLAELSSWSERFAELERWLRDRLAAAADPDPRVEWAERRLRETRGQISVRSLWRELGISERYFTRLFGETIGVTPGRFARLCRFDTLLERLAGSENPLAEIALDVGYYDQSHMARDVRSFAAMAPAGLKTALSRKWPLTEIVGVGVGDGSTVNTARIGNE